MKHIYYFLPLLLCMMLPTYTANATTICTNSGIEISTLNNKIIKRGILQKLSLEGSIYTKKQHSSPKISGLVLLILSVVSLVLFAVLLSQISILLVQLAELSAIWALLSIYFFGKKSKAKNAATSVNLKIKPKMLTLLGVALVAASLFGLWAIPFAAITKGLLRVPLGFLSALLATGAGLCALRAQNELQKRDASKQKKALSKITFFLALGVILTLLTYVVLLFSFL
jgi:cation transport ATPase